MTEQRVCASDTALPNERSLHQYVDDAHHQVVRLRGLLDAFMVLDGYNFDDSQRGIREAQCAVVSVALDLAVSLDSKLDIVNVPRAKQ